MRLSEAIRLGSLMKPQAFGELSNAMGTCALGAAIDAVGSLEVWQAQIGKDNIAGQPSNWYDFWVAHWPKTRTLIVPCPVENCQHTLIGCTKDTMQLGYIITHLNDNHRWSRPDIASWVAEQEDKHGIIESGGRKDCSVEASKPIALEQEQVLTPAPCLTHV